VFDGAQPGGDTSLTSGNGLAVASGVGILGQGLAELLHLADVSFALVSVRRDGKEGDASGRGVKDQGHRLGFGILTGQGGNPRTVDFGPGLAGLGAAVPGAAVEAQEHGVGAVDLVAGGGEVIAGRAEVGAGRRSSS
jgi:hypothetical protein